MGQELLPDPDQSARGPVLADYWRHIYSDAQGARQARGCDQRTKFFEWAYKNGDKTADDLDYVPMPGAVKAQIEKVWGEIKDASGKTVAYK